MRKTLLFILLISAGLCLLFFQMNDLSGDEMQSETLDYSSPEPTEVDIVDKTFQDDIFGVEGYDYMTIDERKEIADAVLTRLAFQGFIVGSTIHFDETSDTYTFMYSSGYLGTLIIKNWNSYQNGVVQYFD